MNRRKRLVTMNIWDGLMMELRHVRLMYLPVQRIYTDLHRDMDAMHTMQVREIAHVEWDGRWL